MATITVTVRKSFPAVDYGVDTYEYGATLDGINEADIAAETLRLTALLNATIAAVVLPLVEAEVTRYASVIQKDMNMKDANPDYGQRGRSKLYAAFRVMYPEVDIPAMAKLDAPPVLVELKD